MVFTSSTWKNESENSVICQSENRVSVVAESDDMGDVVLIVFVLVDTTIVSGINIVVLVADVKSVVVYMVLVAVESGIVELVEKLV